MQAEVHPDGLFDDLPYLWRLVWCEGPAAAWRWARLTARRVAADTRARGWSALRAYLVGYVAYPLVWPDGVADAGYGWTRRAAVRDLHRKLARSCSTAT